MLQIHKDSDGITVNPSGVYVEVLGCNAGVSGLGEYKDFGLKSKTSGFGPASLGLQLQGIAQFTHW